MAISFVAAGTVDTGTTSLSLTVPAGITKDDLLLIVTSSTVPATTPSGWTLLNAEGSGQYLTIFYKFTSGTESTTAVTLSGGSASKGVMMAYRGAGGIEARPAYAANTGTTMTPNTFATTYANDYVVFFYACNSGGATTITRNASTTQRVNSSGATSFKGLLIADELQTSIGTITARAATLSVSRAWSALPIGLIESSRTLYWVGGNGTWDASSNTKWSNTSGGTSGVPAPSLLDNVIVDSNSGGSPPVNPNITLSGTPACNSITTSTTCTISSTGTLTFNGNLTLSSNTTWTANGTLTAVGTGTITTNGVSLASPIVLNGASQTFTLGSNLSTSNTFTLTAGSFALSTYTSNSTTFLTNNSNTRAISFGAGSAINLSGSGTTVWSAATSTGFSTSGTPTVNLTYAGGTGTRTIVHGTTGGSITTANVNFDIVSGTDTIAITTGSQMNDLDFTGFSGTFAPAAAYTLYGNLIAASAMTWTTGTGTITFAATTANKTITSAGKSLYAVTFNGVGGGWTLQDNFTLSNIFTLTNGTVNANTYNVSANSYTFGGGTAIMGSGNWTGSLADTVWNNTGTTIAANTSTIVLSNNSSTALTFAGNGQTYYNLSLPGVSATGTLTLTGANRFNDVSILRTGIYTIVLPSSATTTVNTWSVVAGSSPTTSYYTLISAGGGVGGTNRATLSVPSGTVNPNYAKIRSINATGGATFTATNAQNLGNNSGWNFSGPRYWVGGSGTWNETLTTNWSLSSGGTGGNFPPSSYEDAFFDANSGTGTITLSGNPRSKNLSTIGSSFTFSSTGRLGVGGGINLSSTTVWNASNTLVIFWGDRSATDTTRNNYVVTTNTVTLPCRVSFENSTITLGSDLSVGNSINVTHGARFNTNNYSVTANAFNSQTFDVGNGSPIIIMGSNTWNITGSGNVWIGGAFTLESNTSSLIFSNNSTAPLTFDAQSKTYNNISFTGPNANGTITFSNAPTIQKLSSLRTGAYTINLDDPDMEMFVGQFDVRGTAGNVVTVSATSGVGSIYSLNNTRQSNIDYIAFSNVTVGSTDGINFGPSANIPLLWYVGSNSTATFTGNTDPGTIDRFIFSSDTSSTYYRLDSGTTWTVPSDWNSSNNNVYLFGGGGGSAGGISVTSGTSKISGAGGGGGGFTALTNVTLTPGGTVPYAIGAAGGAGAASSSSSTGTSGGTTTFNTTNTAGGGGGGSGNTTSSTGGTAGTGTTNNGGAGAGGTFATNITRAGSGGGGSGGLDGAGQAGTTGATGTAALGGAGGQGNNNVSNYLENVIRYGDGAAGANASAVTAGNSPTTYAAGAGGGSVVINLATDSTGATGRTGVILIRYAPPIISSGNFFQLFYP